jgi:hypothetical protein
MKASTCSRAIAPTSVGIPCSVRKSAKYRVASVEESTVRGDLFSASSESRRDGADSMRSDTLAAVTAADLVLSHRLHRVSLMRCASGVQAT